VEPGLQNRPTRYPTPTVRGRPAAIRTAPVKMLFPWTYASTCRFPRTT